MKFAIWIGIMVGGTIGGWIGAFMTSGNWLSVTSVLLSGVGSIAGIFVAYRLYNNYFG